MEEVIITRLTTEDIVSFGTLIKEAFDIELVVEKIKTSLLDSNKIYLIAKDKNSNEVIGNILIDIEID